MPEAEPEHPPMVALADAAFRRAAAQVVRRARQFGTPILLWKDGKVLEVSPDEIVLPPEPEEINDAADREKDRSRSIDP